MNPDERRMMARLAEQLKECAAMFYESIDDGDHSAGSWVAIHRNDFRRWERTVTAAKSMIDRSKQIRAERAG
jgi:hypothetical protein